MITQDQMAQRIKLYLRIFMRHIQINEEESLFKCFMKHMLSNSHSYCTGYKRHYQNFKIHMEDFDP